MHESSSLSLPTTKNDDLGRRFLFEQSGDLTEYFTVVKCLYMTTTSPQREALWDAILTLKTTSEARKFFGDLLTDDEITDVAKRWQVARMLNAGASYTLIQKETAMSTRTIARISSWLKEGFGGYRFMLDRMNAHHHTVHPPHRRLTAV